MSMPRKSPPGSDWTTPRRVRLALWIAIKLVIIILLARTDTLQFVYAGF